MPSLLSEKIVTRRACCITYGRHCPAVRGGEGAMREGEDLSAMARVRQQGGDAASREAKVWWLVVWAAV